jgi:NADH:ubiquinone oxidoreductase subunit K
VAAVAMAVGLGLLLAGWRDRRSLVGAPVSTAEPIRG